MPADESPPTTVEAAAPEGGTSPREATLAALSTVEHEPGAAKPDPILVADNVHRHFGGLVAVDVEHLEVQRGSITALIEPYGDGNYTYFNILTDFDQTHSSTWSHHSIILYNLP